MLALAAAQARPALPHLRARKRRAGLRRGERAHTIAAFEDEAALARFAEAVDVVTYEFENVPVASVEFLSRAPARCAPARARWR